MKKYLLLLSILFVCLSAFSQDQTERKLVLGIGNADIDVYHRTIDLINGNQSLKVINTCEEHRIIVVSNNSSAYKTDNDVIGFLQSEISDLLIYLKDESILFNECLGEIEKQKRVK